MKLSVIAIDYDGTIARGDVLDPAVRPAIAAARTSGIIILLVTGRILEDLRRVAGDLHFVDGVIAENGAIVHFPDSGHTSTLAPPVPDGFVTELRRRGIPFGLGRSLVDADAAEAPRLLEVIRALELPLVLIFNGGRVMVLPQGVSKATGLHAALDTLRLSARNTVAIGDAENDHELLRLAEVGVAVEWGSPALRSAADVVLQGSGPPAVSAYVRTLADSGRLPIPARARRRLLLGYMEDGREFSLAVRGRNVLIAGDAKSGKSWVAGLLCEPLILHGYCLCVIDPEGDYRAASHYRGSRRRSSRVYDRSAIDASRPPPGEVCGRPRDGAPGFRLWRERTTVRQARPYLASVRVHPRACARGVPGGLLTERRLLAMDRRRVWRLSACRRVAGARRPSPRWCIGRHRARNRGGDPRPVRPRSRGGRHGSPLNSPHRRGKKPHSGIRDACRNLDGADLCRFAIQAQPLLTASRLEP